MQQRKQNDKIFMQILRPKRKGKATENILDIPHFFHKYSVAFLPHKNAPLNYTNLFQGISFLLASN